MKKILFMLFAAMFSFSGCSSDDDNSENPDMIGKWEKMEVSAKDANIEKKGSYDYIYVPTDGSSFTLQVNNYKNSILKNTSSETRTIELSMTAGDIFETIYIVQAGK